LEKRGLASCHVKY